ncbi:hypothetical protein Poly51_21020 [Rubripirellula tenax]|uniref:Uncharacterized protein n=1 Tax=Rubripirellula tenax TaxID=2528015 RepID=A0A5C6FGK4_9BACT|nr:hypothetical protein [Rubripirellula tenax]TWU59314.1 hypothetical protein Poly51_21020 [Rubripirellula tenax]
MSADLVPESRAYRHITCGSETVVGGQSFEVVSNPMSSMEQTKCSMCNAMFPISDYVWADTDENLSDYYARHTTTATDLQRLLCSKKMMVGLVAVSALAAAAGVYVLVANDDLFTRTICLLGGLMIGAFIGATLFLHVFANPITRKVCGVRDTRLLR